MVILYEIILYEIVKHTFYICIYKLKCIYIACMKLYSFAFEACCKTESLAKEDFMQNLRLNYHIEAETYTGTKKFSRVWFGINGNTRPHSINRTVTLDSTKLIHCQKEIVYLKVK